MMCLVMLKYHLIASYFDAIPERINLLNNRSKPDL